MGCIELLKPWNSLEIVKLILTGFTPVILAFIGLFLNRQLKRFEHRQWRNQKLIEKRLVIYDDIFPLFNDLFCYYTYVGNWKSFKPNEMVDLKRKLDKKIYLAKPMFSQVFFDEAIAFMNICYKPYQGWGVDAKLLTDFSRRKLAAGNSWESQWDELFVSEPNEIAPVEQIRIAYNKVILAFSNEIGIIQ